MRSAYEMVTAYDDHNEHHEPRSHSGEDHHARITSARRRFNSLNDLKVEPAIAKDHQKVQAIRVYPGKLMKEIDSTIESGETPGLIVKKEFSKNRKVEEVSLVFKGTYHIEDLNYYTKDPDTWTTWGEIYMTPAQALQLADKIKQIAKAPAGEPGQLVLIQNMTVRIRRRRTHARAQRSARRKER